MHDRPRHTFVTLLQEARIDFRNLKDLDAIATSKIAGLPEDDSCHHARESFQDGMGYAYLKSHSLPEPSADDAQMISELPDNPVDVFFATRPTHSSLKEYEEWCRTAFTERLSRHPTASSLNIGDYRINEYEYEAFLAFIGGYRLVAELVGVNQQEVSM